MRTKQNYRLLARLNRKAVFVTFKDASWHNELCDTAEAFYFGSLISLSFPMHCFILMIDYCFQKVNRLTVLGYSTE